ncbi:hypothetical protein B7494_g3004 [Chlorociboria aeruginascens]|nr:hypothetical protein B7494_g3004 [Chlorociboria aeruginascens]
MDDYTCFFYGTLMVPKILYRAIYGTTDPDLYTDLHALASKLSFSPALLPNFSRRHVRYADYPGITAQAGETVRGVLVTGLTKRDLIHLDRFEGAEYVKQKVEVAVLEGEPLLGSVGNGNEHGDGKADGKGQDVPVEALTYVFKNPEGLEEMTWDFERFQREKMWRWTGEKYEEFEEVDEERERDPTGGRDVNTKLASEEEREALKNDQSQPPIKCPRSLPMQHVEKSAWDVVRRHEIIRPPTEPRRKNLLINTTMAETLGLVAGIAGIISLALQIAQGVAQFHKDLKDAPDNVKTFMAELKILRIMLSEINILLNLDFEAAVQNQPSLQLSQVVDLNAASITDIKPTLEICQRQLESLLSKLEKRGQIGPLRWKRFKAALLAKDTRDSVKNLSRQCQNLSSILGHKSAKKEWQECQKWRQAETVALSAIKGGVDQFNQWHTTQDRQAILNWLTPMDYASQQSDLIHRRQAETGKWFLNSTEFQTWLNTNKETLFCTGMPGAGKTMLASIVVNYLDERFFDNKAIGIAYIYCNFQQMDQQKAEDILASLLKRFAECRQPSLPDSVKDLYDRHKTKQTRPSIDEIFTSLQSVIASYSRVFIVIDALDECQAYESRFFLQKLFSLQANCEVNHFATSRSIPEVTKEFEKSMFLKIRASDEDVQRYLDGNMFKLRESINCNRDLQEEIKTEIVKSVDGMFLLAKLHFESLIGKMTPRAIRTALKRLPTGSDACDHAYKGAMERIEEQFVDQERLAKQVLSWITCATRPLTTMELRHALAIEPSDIELGEDNLLDVKDIVSVCAGLVTIDDKSNIIRLVHYTAQEYFERTRGQWFPDAEIEITKTCITYLSFTAFQNGFCETDDEFEERLQLHPLYDYVSKNWGHHARKASTSCDEVIRFLRNQAQVEASSQGLMALNKWSGHTGYSQEIPKQITGLHLAAYFGIDDTISVITSNSPNPKDSYGQTPLSYAAMNGHEGVVKLLLAEKVEADSKDENGRTPMSHAAMFGHAEVVKLLLTQDGVDPDSKDNNSQTPLLLAAIYGHGAIAKLLLGTDRVAPEFKDAEYGRTALSWAAENGSTAVAEELLGIDGVDLDSMDNNGRTPLSYAVAAAQTNTIQLLLDHGASLATIDHQLKGLLHYAISNMNCKLETVETLLARGAPTDLVDISNMTPLHNTVRFGRQDIAKLLIQKKTLVGDCQMVQFFLDQGANPNAISYHGETPLHLTLRKDVHGPKYKDCWTDDDLRIEALQNLDAEDEVLNEIHEFIPRQRMNIIDRLLNHSEVDIKIQDAEGASVLHRVPYGMPKCNDIVTKLIDKGADVSAWNSEKQSPLQLACLRGDSASVEVLLSHSADVLYMDSYGLNALHYAAKSRNIETISCILRKCDANCLASKDKMERNALHHTLARAPDIKAVQMLLIKGCSVKDKDIEGNSPLAFYLCNSRGRIANDVCRLLLESGSDALAVNGQGLTLAHLSTKHFNLNAANLETLIDSMSAIQAPSAPQISRINFRHPPTDPNSDPYPCRLYLPAIPPHGSASAISTGANIPLEPAAEENHNGRPKPDVLFTHGAGSQLDNPALDAFAEGLARTHTVLCFEDQGSVQQRAATFRSLLDAFPSVAAFGGRSKGSVAAVEASLHSNVKRLILFSLPLSYDRSSDPGRDLLHLPQDLLLLQQDVEVLFIGGDRDELCVLEDLAEIRKRMKARSWWIRIEGADHGIKFEMEKRRSVCKFVGNIAGKWLSGDVSAFSEGEKTADVLVGWDESGKELKSTLLEG